MDLNTMRKKLSMGKYRRVADIRADFILMMDNCTKFNRGNAFFYKYGQRMRRIGVTQIKAAEQEDSIVQNVSWFWACFFTKTKIVSVSMAAE